MMADVHLHEDDAVFVCVVLRQHKQLMRVLGIHTRDADGVLNQIHAAFPLMALADPQTPVADGPPPCVHSLSTSSSASAGGK